MFDPFDKIMSVNVSPESRLSEEDRAFVDNAYKKQDEIIDKISNFHPMLNIHRCGDPDIERFIDGCQNRLKDMIEYEKINCISSVFEYFEKKYAISLENAFPIQKTPYGKKWYQDLATRANELSTDIRIVSKSGILNLIFDQLTGLSFEEKKTQDITMACRRLFRDYKDSDMVVDGSTLKLWTGFLRYVSHGYSSKKVWCLHCSWTKEAISFFTAISHLECGMTEPHEKFWFYTNDRSNLAIDESDLFSKQTFGLEKVMAIKKYKNGSMHIWFDSNSTAERFKRVYMGR